MKLREIKLRNLSVGFTLTTVLLLMPAVLAAQEKITFTSSRDGNSEIYVMNADGMNQKRLTNNSSGDGSPAFSADGSKIAFTSSRDGNNEIYVMNADGTKQTRLTNNPAADESPAWSPDGSKIAFTSFRDGTGADIWLMNADGSNPINLTNYPGNDTEPTFSPNGRKIAFRGLRDGVIDVFVMNVDGTDQIPVSNNPSIDTQPAYSPDGQTIAFRSGDNDREIYVMDADGANQVNLTNNPAFDAEPWFSLDGTKIAFMTIRDGNDEIYVMNADGSNPINLTNNAASDSHPSWGPANTTPVLENLSISSPVNEGEWATLTGRIKDPDQGDSFTIGVEWKDIAGVQWFELPAGTTTFELQHQFIDDRPDNTSSDNYTVNLTVDDHRFGIGTGSVVATVNNVDPMITNLTFGPSSVVLGSSVNLSLSVEDVAQRSLDADEEGLKLFLDWGDGQTENITVIPVSLIVGTHKYAAIGSYTITLKATDNDLGETVLTLGVEVTPPPPPSAPTGLRVEYIAMNRIQLVWTDTSSNEDGFAIERCSQRGCNNFLEIGRTFPDIRAFLDVQLFSNTQYYYRVRSFNAGGKSAYTDVVSAKTLRK